MEQRILVFASQNEAAAAVQRMTATMGLSGSTFLYATPQALADGRWCVPYPSDPAWLAGVVGSSVAAGTGLVAVGESAVHVPSSVTLFQARAVMMGLPSPSGVAGRTLFDDVDASLQAKGGVALQAWEYSSDVERRGPLVLSMMTALGMTSDQADALFIRAAGITA